MRRIFSFLFIFIFLIIAGVVALPYLLSSDQVWQQVNPILEKQLGRKITVNGQRKFELYPNLLLKLSDVTIDDNESESHLIKLDQLLVGVELLPLISGKINVKQLILSGADINLRKNVNGVPNWQNAEAVAPLPADNADPLGDLIEKSVAAPAPSNAISDGASFDIANLNIKNFKIINSRLSYIDAQNATSQRIDNINADIQLLDNNKSLNISGNLVWNEEKLNINLTRLNLSAILEQQPTPLDLTLKSKKMSLKLLGSLKLSDKIHMQGKLTSTIPDLSQTAKWLKLDIGNLKTSTVKLDTNFKVSGTTYQLAQLSLNVFGSAISGTLNVSLAKKPNIYGKLNVDVFSPDNIVKTSKVTPKSTGWRKEPFDLGFLSSLNTNIALKIGRINMANIQADNVSTTVIIRKSTLKIPLKLQIFGGHANTQINAQLLKSGVQFSNHIVLENINMSDALSSVNIQEKLEGTGNANIKITSHGTSLYSIMQNLGGGGNIILNDGAIKGIAMADALAPELANVDLSLNSPKKLLNFAVQAGKNLFTQNVSDMMTSGFGNNVGAQKQTKFVKAEMSFKLAKGVLTNDDLKINSTNIFIHGAGKVNLFKQSLNYRIIPKLLRKASQGGGERMAIPMIITGKWFAPDIKVDYAYALENSSTLSNMRDKVANKITEQITRKVTNKVVKKVTQQIGNKLGDKIGKQVSSEITNQIGNLLGNKSNNQAGELLDDGTSNDKKLELDAGKLLNTLFN